MSNDPIKDAESIFRAGLARVDSRAMMARVLTLEGDTLTLKTETESVELDLRGYKRILVMAVGKAASRMALGLHDVLGDRIAKGFVVTKHGHEEDELPPHFALATSSHPIPDESSVAAAERLKLFCESARSDDLLIGLVSGGGSSLAALPVEGISLGDKQLVTKLLLSSGATINEVNAVRKRLSRIKGGKLLSFIHPADSLNLVLSDVVGDDLDVIASGMTVPHHDSDDTLARETVERYAVSDRLPANVLEVLRSPQELPRSMPLWLRNLIVGSNAQALGAAAAEAQRLGYAAMVMARPLVGEAKQAAKIFLDEAKAAYEKNGRQPTCYLAGGETTVTLRGLGKGGRNQEMALASLPEFGSLPEGAVFLAASTDGGDGPTDAAGAFAARAIVERASRAGFDVDDFLARNDSYSYFEKAGGLLKTGPTNTNVCDLQIAVFPRTKG